MFCHEKFDEIKNILERQLVRLYGDEIAVKKLKTVLCYSSTESVIVAISDRCLVLPVYGIGPVKGRAVKASELAAYIANQYARSLEKKMAIN